jgi:hypothetical protein
MSGNFSGAGSALSAGYGGSAMTAADLAASQAASAGATAAAGSAGGAVAGGTAPAATSATSAASAAAPSAWTTSPTGLNVLASEAAPAAANAATGSGGGMLSNFFRDPRNTPALLQAGSGMLGSLGQAQQQKAMYQREDERQEDMRRRYGANIGTRLWGS